MVAVPPLSTMDMFSEDEPIPIWELPVVVGGVPDAGVATSDTVPPFAGVGVTLMLNVAVLPCLIVKGAAGVVLEIVTESAVNDAVDHAVRRFPTFSEPRPVAKS